MAGSRKGLHISLLSCFTDAKQPSNQSRSFGSSDLTSQSPQTRESDERDSLLRHFRRGRRPPSSQPLSRRPHTGEAIVGVHNAGCAKRPGLRFRV